MNRNNYYNAFYKYTIKLHTNMLTNFHNKQFEHQKKNYKLKIDILKNSR